MATCVANGNSFQVPRIDDKLGLTPLQGHLRASHYASADAKLGTKAEFVPHAVNASSDSVNPPSIAPVADQSGTLDAQSGIESANSGRMVR
jgi:hypothetical protein